MYINAAADSVALCLQHDFYNTVFNTLPPGWPFNQIPPVPGHFTRFKCETPEWILSYDVPVQMNLPDPALKNLRTEVPAVPH
jgi:hypothetical protein